MSDEIRRWSVETFGRANLGDERRVRRLVQIGIRAAERPDGRISTVFRSARDREGAYDFVENRRIPDTALGKAVFGAAARAAREHSYAFVAVDETSIQLRDDAETKDFGAIGTYAKKARGLQVVNGLVLSPVGVPLGLGAQVWWKRSLQKPTRRHHMSVPVAQKETQYWLDALKQVCDAFDDHAPNVRPWFQIDREGDAWAVIRMLAQRDQQFTIRSAHDRRLEGKRRRYLRKTLEKQPVRHTYQLELAARKGHKKLPDRKARTATIAVRVAAVTLLMREKRMQQHHPAKVNALLIRESRTAPRTEEPLSWILLTNAPANTSEEIERIIFGYTQRWRIEDLHKSWKTGCCNVERTQLHSTAAVIQWATILAAVAVRVERLKHLSRSSRSSRNMRSPRYACFGRSTDQAANSNRKLLRSRRQSSGSPNSGATPANPQAGHLGPLRSAEGWSGSHQLPKCSSCSSAHQNDPNT